METGRKFWIAVIVTTEITAITLCCMFLKFAMPDAAIAALATVAGFFMGANAASTFATARTGTQSEATTRTITERRTPDGMEPTA